VAGLLAGALCHWDGVSGLHCYLQSMSTTSWNPHRPSLPNSAPRQVGTLVNCAGMYQPPAFLEELPDQRIQDMLVINSYVPTMVSEG